MSEMNNRVGDYIQASIQAKAAWRKSRAQLTFGEKIAILDELKAASSIFQRVVKPADRPIDALPKSFK
jgi:hypothetical protein